MCSAPVRASLAKPRGLKEAQNSSASLINPKYLYFSHNVSFLTLFYYKSRNVSIPASLACFVLQQEIKENKCNTMAKTFVKGVA